MADSKPEERPAESPQARRGPHHVADEAGREARRQMLETAGRLPDYVVACVGGGSNAIGMFHPFVPDAGVAQQLPDVARW